MLDFTNIQNPEQYAGKWIAFIIDEATNTTTVLYSGESVYDVVNSTEVQDKKYVLHKFQ